METVEAQPRLDPTVLPPAVAKVLSLYDSEPPGVVANLTRVLMHGTLAGTGKLLAYPVDQRVEHGPARTHAPNPAGYDPRYHCRLALKAGCSFHTTHLGAISIVAREYAGLIPLVLKANGATLLNDLRPDPAPALMASVDDALRLGCVGVGFTINPGSARSNETFGQLRDLVAEARNRGLFTVCWAYVRGSGVPRDSKEMEQAIDVVGYAALLAAELGAHIIKVKPPTELIALKGNQEVYKGIPISNLSDRVRHVMECVLAGQRIVLFSGMEKTNREEVLTAVSEVAAGGATGSIIGRNVSQRPEAEALAFIGDVVRIWKDRAREESQAV